MQLSPELEMVSCNNSGPESATITHVSEGFLTWAIPLNWCSLGWGIITESALILLPPHKYFFAALSQLLGVLSLCKNLKVERQRMRPWGLEFPTLTMAGILIQSEKAESLHVSHSRHSALICYWAAVRNLLFWLKVWRILNYCRKEGENQQNWARMAPWVL